MGVDHPGRALLVLGGAYLLVLLYVQGPLQADLLTGDVRHDAFHGLYLHQHLDRWHVPGYHALIAALHAVLPTRFPPLITMMAIASASLLASCLLVYRFLGVAGLDRRRAAWAMLLFALWPFEGLVDVVYPRADMLAIALLLAGLVLLQDGRPRSGAIVVGLAAITHKALWPAAALVWLLHHVPRRAHTSPLLPGLLIALPLATVWCVGLRLYGDPTWLIAENVSAELVSRSPLPVLDGMLGTLLFQGPSGWAKGLWLGAVLGLCATSAAAAWRYRLRDWELVVPLAAGLVLLGLVVNQHEYWIVGRLGRLAVLPMMVAFGRVQIALPRWSIQAGTAVVLAALLASQFLWAWYSFARS